MGRKLCLIVYVLMEKTVAILGFLTRSYIHVSIRNSIGQ